MYSREADAGPEVRLRTMRILWVVFLITVGLYALVGYISNPMSDVERAVLQGEPAPTGIPTLLLLLFALGFLLIVVSFVTGEALYKKAAAQQRPDIFQTGFILAVVFSESAALFGLIGLFVTGNRYAYALLAAAALGVALQFPRRGKLLSAYYEQAW